jgi:hypothetical protein
MSKREWRRDIEVILPPHDESPAPSIDRVPRGLIVDLGRVREALRWREYADDLLELAVMQIEELRDRDPRGFAWARDDLIEVVRRFLP